PTSVWSPRRGHSSLTFALLHASIGLRSPLGGKHPHYYNPPGKASRPHAGGLPGEPQSAGEGLGGVVVVDPDPLQEVRWASRRHEPRPLGDGAAIAEVFQDPLDPGIVPPRRIREVGDGTPRPRFDRLAAARGLAPRLQIGRASCREGGGIWRGRGIWSIECCQGS